MRLRKSLTSLESKLRLNKFIAQATGVSRREADELVSSGKVTVNGEEPELGKQVGDADIVALNREIVSLPSELTYVLVNKPKGHVTSRNSQDGSPTIYEMLPDEYSTLKYVGRLDKESSGLILMTNDGDYSHKMTHPSFRKEKVYGLTLERSLNKEDVDQINGGVELEDGKSSMSVSEVKGKTCVVAMSEGRNRQIRRTFGALNHTITKLQRISFGPYKIDDLKDNEFIEVKKREV